MEGIHGAGKGDTYRHVDYQKWSDNYDAIFGKKKASVKNGSKDNRSKDRRANSKSSGNRRKGSSS